MAKKEIRHAELVSASENIEVPYELPEGWKWCRLGEVAETLTGSTPSKKNPKYYHGTFPFFKPADLEQSISLFQASEYLSEEGKKVSRIIPANSTLICCIGSIGKSGYSLREGTANQQINAAIPNEKIDSKFLFYSVNTENFKNQLWNKSSSTTISIINKSKMDSCFIPLPPTLAEQQRIVSRIESLFTKLEEAKDRAQSVLDGFEKRKAVILHKAFSGELTAKWRKENGVSDDSWEEKTIGECFTHTTGKALKKDNQTGTLHEYITTSNLYWDKFDFSEVRTMYFTDDELEKCTAKKGDLLLCNGGDVGRAAIWNFDYDICLQNHISKLRNKGSVKTRLFLYYFMLSKIKGNVNGKGIGISSLSAKDLLAMSINLPTLPEQQEIVRILDSVLQKEATAKEAAQNVLDKIAMLKKSILARAFRGEL